MESPKIRILRLEGGFRWVLLHGSSADPWLVGDARSTVSDALASLHLARACAVRLECYQRGATGFVLLDDKGIILAGHGGFPDERARDAAIDSVRSALPSAPLEDGDLSG